MPTASLSIKSAFLLIQLILLKTLGIWVTVSTLDHAISNCVILLAVCVNMVVWAEVTHLLNHASRRLLTFLPLKSILCMLIAFIIKCIGRSFAIMRICCLRLQRSSVFSNYILFVQFLDLNFLICHDTAAILLINYMLSGCTTCIIIRVLQRLSRLLLLLFRFIGLRIVIIGIKCTTKEIRLPACLELFLWFC